MTDAVVKGLSTFQQVLIWVINIFWVYQFIISVTSLIKFKEKPLLIDKKHRFIIALPANNEETVIGNLIKSLKMQDYDKDLFDIYVIADNCTDNTAKIARENGAIVYERFDETKKTKGYALNWFLSKMKVKKDDYDALLVFDADNIVDKNFLNVMNKKLCQGEVLVQGYRNRLYHLARYNMGLSPLINGTAFMVKWDMLIDEGWNTKTLTEDIEFALINISKGVKLGWAKDAIVYDEQPLTFKQSWKQRERWSVRTSSMCKWIFKRFSKSSI